MSAVLAVEALVGRETVPLGEFTVPADGELAVRPPPASHPVQP